MTDLKFEFSSEFRFPDCVVAHWQEWLRVISSQFSIELKTKYYVNLLLRKELQLGCLLL